MYGDLEGARKFITDLLADTPLPPGTYNARLEMTLCFLSWIAADLPSLRFDANCYRDLAETLGLAESVAIAHYFLGILDYQLNSLSQAEASLLPVMSERRMPNLEYYTESAFALASCTFILSNNRKSSVGEKSSLRACKLMKVLINFDSLPNKKKGR